MGTNLCGAKEGYALDNLRTPQSRWGTVRGSWPLLTNDFIMCRYYGVSQMYMIVVESHKLRLTSPWRRRTVGQNNALDL